MKFTLRQIDIFLAIAQHENITKAAECLHMSQSAASAALQSLESNYNVSLFKRVGKKLELTQTGKTLRSDAEALIKHATQFEQHLEQHESIGHLRIGASFTIGNHLAIGYLAQYLNQYPQAHVEFDVTNTPDVVSSVLNFEVDIGMIEAEVQHKDLELIPWRDDKLVVFCSPDHPFAQKGSLSDNDIKAAKWILREPDSGARHTFDRALSGLMPDLNIYLEFKHNEAIKKAVEAGLGIGCLSEIVLESNLKNGDLVPLTLDNREMLRQFYFALPKKRFPNKAVNNWIEECTK